MKVLTRVIMMVITCDIDVVWRSPNARDVSSEVIAILLSFKTRTRLRQLVLL
jgi:hypothetical protein